MATPVSVARTSPALSYTPITRPRDVRAQGRIPSLDGIRAVAILLVLWAHAVNSRGYPVWADIWTANPHYRIGGLGVRIFFVLSGFLITGLLLKERAATGTVSLKRFYIRRTLRIAPAYLCYLVAVALVVTAGWGRLSSSDAWHALTYTVNYAPDRSHLVEHLWSLAVEEQFYVLWPATVAGLSLIGSGRAALSVVVLAPVVRLAAATWAPQSVQASGSAFESTADSLAVGCLLALWRERLWASELYRRAVLSRWFGPALFALGMAAGVWVKLGVLVGQTLVTLAIALGIDRSVRRPTGLVGRFLNWAPMAAIGVGSYSLYLWQQLVLNGTPDSAIPFPVNLVLAGLLAWASYQWIEKTVLRFREARERRARRVSTPLKLGDAPMRG